MTYTPPPAPPISYQPTFYYITISNVGGYPSSVPNDGFIDYLTVEDYARINNLNLETGIPSFNLSGAASSESKSRANYRYKNLILQLNRVCNIQLDDRHWIDSTGTFHSNIVTTGSPNYNAEPATIRFTVMVEHGDASLQTWDELNPGTLLTGTAALTRFVVRALANPPSGVATTPATDPSTKMAVYNPTAAEVAGNTNSVPRNGTIIETIDVGAVVFGANVVTNYTNAAALVTITQPFPTP